MREYRVTAHLFPNQAEEWSRATLDPMMERLAEQGHFDWWDGEELEGFLAELAKAPADANEFGWFGRCRPAYEAGLTLVAASEEDARRRVLDRLALPDHWTVELEASAAE